MFTHVLDYAGIESRTRRRPFRRNRPSTAISIEAVGEACPDWQLGIQPSKRAREPKRGQAFPRGFEDRPTGKTALRHRSRRGQETQGASAMACQAMKVWQSRTFQGPARFASERKRPESLDSRGESRRYR